MCEPILSLALILVICHIINFRAEILVISDGKCFESYQTNQRSLVFTVRLHVMQCTILLLQFCPSVCLSDACIVTKLNDGLQMF